MEVGYKHYYGI